MPPRARRAVGHLGALCGEPAAGGAVAPLPTCVPASRPRTYFGKEAEVVAHTYLDPHRVEKPQNHWVLVTGSPRKDSPTMLHLLRPPVQDSCAPGQAAEQGASDAPGAPSP